MKHRLFSCEKRWEVRIIFWIGSFERFQRTGSYSYNNTMLWIKPLMKVRVKYITLKLTVISWLRKRYIKPTRFRLCVDKLSYNEFVNIYFLYNFLKYSVTNINFAVQRNISWFKHTLGYWLQIQNHSERFILICKGITWCIVKDPTQKNDSLTNSLFVVGTLWRSRTIGSALHMTTIMSSLIWDGVFNALVRFLIFCFASEWLSVTVAAVLKMKLKTPHLQGKEENLTMKAGLVRLILCHLVLFWFAFIEL